MWEEALSFEERYFNILKSRKGTSDREIKKSHRIICNLRTKIYRRFFSNWLLSFLICIFRRERYSSCITSTTDEDSSASCRLWVANNGTSRGMLALFSHS
jgi:hypothetical protein